MATAYATAFLPKFTPILNAPPTVAIAGIPGKMVPSMGGDAPSELVFSLVDGRAWYARHEPAGEGCSFHQRPIMPPDYLDPETGCTAAEMKQEEPGGACPMERELCDGVRTGRPLRDDAVYPKGEVA